MLTYSAHPEFVDVEHSQAVISVHSHRCLYRVAITQGEVHVIGPGVEETLSIDDLPQNLPYEALALCAVLLFEEQE